MTLTADSFISFCDHVLLLNEKGKPWSLSAYQRRVIAWALRQDADGRLLVRTLLWSEPKKSGKTFLAACFLLWWGSAVESTEIIVAANDAEQAQSRVFKTAVDLLRHNPQLGADVRVFTSTLEFSNGTLVTAIASEYTGAAGARHSLVIFDELWGYGSERLHRLFEELTIPPTEENGLVLIVTYAGVGRRKQVAGSPVSAGTTGPPGGGRRRWRRSAGGLLRGGRPAHVLESHAAAALANGSLLQRPAPAFAGRDVPAIALE